MRKSLYILLFLSGLLSGCDDFCDSYLTKKPTADVASENFWKTEADVETATRQVYALYADHFGGPVVRLYRTRALPFDYVSSLWLNVSKNYLHLIWPKDAPEISWQNEYNIISEINKVLYYIDRADMTEDRRNEYIAQMRTMRAIVHLYVADNWGACPYKTDYFDIGPIGRTPQADVYRLCASELEAAIPYLSPASEIRNADGSLNSSKEIPARGTAQAYLALAYTKLGVQTNDQALMQKALTAAESVINSGDYSLIPTVKDFCKIGLMGNSCEGIHEVDFNDTDGEENNHNACMFGAVVKYPLVPNSTPATSRSLARFSYKKAKDMFSPLDDWWENAFYKPDSMILLPAAQTREAVYIYKFRNLFYYNDGNKKGQIRAINGNEIIIRLPDMYFVAAEMCARLNNLEKAKEYLNIVRRRANGPDYSETEGDLLRAIFKTWVKERFMEGFDLEYQLRVHFGYISELSGDFSIVTDPESYFLPVGEGAFRDNPLMDQNDYWGGKGY